MPEMTQISKELIILYKIQIVVKKVLVQHKSPLDDDITKLTELIDSLHTPLYDEDLIFVSR